MTNQENNLKVRRQAERIIFDIYHDPDLQWYGLHCNMDIGPFARANKWRNWQVRRALFELEKAGYIQELNLDYGKAVFRVKPPRFLIGLLKD